MTTLATLSPAIALDSFESRCFQLKLFAWEFDAAAHCVARPALPSPLDSLLRAAPLEQLLLEAAARFLKADIHDAPPGAEEISPGLWVIPIVVRNRRRATGLTLVLGVEPAIGFSPFLSDLACAAGISDNDARHALFPFLRSVRTCAEDLTATLRWMHADLCAAGVARKTLDEFSTSLSQSYEQVNFVFRLARYLNSMQEPLELVHLLLAQIREILPFSWVAVRFRPDQTLIPNIGEGFRIAGETAHADAIERAADEILGRQTADNWTKILTPAQHPLAALLGAEILAEPIHHDKQVIGLLLAGNKTGDDPDIASTDIQLLDAIANFFGLFHENIARFAEQRDLFLGSLQAITGAIDAKDPYTRGHSERVAMLAAQLARAIGLPDKTVEQYRIAGMVHDVGKIGIAESVLRKPGKLTDEEYAQIQKHPRIGYDILKNIPPLADVLPGVLNHHERWDGRGYPEKIGGPKIALVARVLALADTFDAMSSHRAYRAPRPREVVLEEIRKNAGAQFDPDLVPHFLTLDFTEFDAHVASCLPQQIAEVSG